MVLVLNGGITGDAVFWVFYLEYLLLLYFAKRYIAMLELC